MLQLVHDATTLNTVHLTTVGAILVMLDGSHRSVCLTPGHASPDQTAQGQVMGIVTVLNRMGDVVNDDHQEASYTSTKVDLPSAKGCKIQIVYSGSLMNDNCSTAQLITDHVEDMLTEENKS